MPDMIKVQIVLDPFDLETDCQTIGKRGRRLVVEALYTSTAFKGNVEDALVRKVREAVRVFRKKALSS